MDTWSPFMKSTNGLREVSVPTFSRVYYIDHILPTCLYFIFKRNYKHFICPFNILSIYSNIQNKSMLIKRSIIKLNFNENSNTKSHVICVK